MRVTNNILLKIIKIQEENEIANNKLLLIVMSLNNFSEAAIKSILNTSTKEENEFYLNLLTKEDILTIKDTKLLYKLLNKKMTSKKNIQITINKEAIIDHLNNLLGTKLRMTKGREVLIEKWYNKEYLEEDFFKVNTYYYFLWKDDPKMHRYIRPETLYNGKFESRVEEANSFFADIEEHLQEIEIIKSEYSKAYEKYVTKSNLNNSDLNIDKLIVFWLKKFSLEDILLTINMSIEEWSKNINLRDKIFLEKLLDQKFPERLKVSLSRKSISHLSSGMQILKEWYEDSDIAVGS